MFHLFVLTVTGAAAMTNVNVASVRDDSLALVPPMGWMSWEIFRCQVDCNTHPDSCINEKLYMDHADRLSEDGYFQAGYNRVHIDDCWMTKDGPIRNA